MMRLIESDFLFWAAIHVARGAPKVIISDWVVGHDDEVRAEIVAALTVG